MSRRPVDNVIVLGHTGFIGRHVLQWLRHERPWLEVSGLSRADLDLTSSADVDRFGERVAAGTALVVCSGVKRHVDESFAALQTNLQMAENLARLLAARLFARVCYFSSAAVYGEGRDDLSMDESTPVRPQSYYGIAKLASECLLLRTVPPDAIQILRPAVVYGVGDEKEGYRPSAFARTLLSGEGVCLWGDGSERRDFIHVDDVAEVTCRLLLDTDMCGVVNVATGQARSFIEVVNLLTRAIESAGAISSRPRTRPAVSQGYRVDRLRAALPALRMASLEEGLAKVVVALGKSTGLHVARAPDDGCVAVEEG